MAGAERNTFDLEKKLTAAYEGAGQPRRSSHERGLSQEELYALDMGRAKAIQRRVETPELFAQMDRIESKLDRLLQRLEDRTD